MGNKKYRMLVGAMLCGPCHHDIARAQVVDGGDSLQIWWVATNIVNEHSRTADKGWPSGLVVGRGANNSSP
jgi:hypothetical protein